MKNNDVLSFVFRKRVRYMTWRYVVVRDSNFDRVVDSVDHWKTMNVYSLNMDQMEYSFHFPYRIQLPMDQEEMNVLFDNSLVKVHKNDNH